MKKINFIVLGMLLASGLALTSGSKVIAKAENGNVAINNFKTWKFAAGWETSQVYTNEGVKVTVPGADTKGDSAWQYSAELPANDSRDTFAFDVSDSLTLEILVKMYDASTNTQLSESVGDSGCALEFYFANSSTNKDFAMLRIWANSGGWTNADHSFEIYNIVNDSTIWTSQKAADYWVKGDAAGNNKFTLVFDKENIVSSYVGGNDSLVTLGNSTFIETAKTAISDASGVYVRVKGSNGFTKNTDVTLCSINGQSLANDGTNFVDNVAPVFTKSSVAKVAGEVPAYQEYEIPAEGNDLFGSVAYAISVDGNEKVGGKKFTPTPGNHEVTLCATDLGGNVTSKSFTLNATYSAATFIDEWHSLRVDGSICEMLSDDNASKLEKMFAKFDAFDASTKETIRDTIDIDDVKIGETMDYLKMMLANKANKTNSTNQSIVNIAKEDVATTSIVLLLALGILPVVGYFLISKKRKEI